jgi:YesN/AraC family two-component response regulator
MCLRLLIVDDHEVVRVGLRNLLLSHRPDWKICGEAVDGRDGIAKTFKLTPDVVILDFAMPVMNGMQAATEIRGTSPETKIILLSAHDIPKSIWNGWVDDFVSKHAAAQELVGAVERVVGPPGRGERTGGDPSGPVPS